MNDEGIEGATLQCSNAKTIFLIYFDVIIKTKDPLRKQSSFENTKLLDPVGH